MLATIIVVGLFVDQAAASMSRTSDADSLASSVMKNAGRLTGAEFEVSPSDFRSAGIGDSAVTKFPTHGGTFGVLSTGDVLSLEQPNNSSSTGAQLGSGTVRGAFDVTVLRIGMNVPAGVNCLTVDFQFLSEEFPEYVGSSFNDAFTAELDDSNWSVSGSSIGADNNFAFDPEGNPITINAAGATSMTAEEASGTTFDGATPLLRAATPVTPGVHSLYLSIFDAGDASYDSMALFDQVQFLTVANVNTQCRQGADVVDKREYVALGDSYSSGFGVSPYFPATNKDNGPNDCQRSTRAYPSVVRDGYGLNLDFHACQGAVTKDFYEARNTTWGEPPQLDHLNQETGMVTFSIGGNDAHFAEVLAECILGMELLPFNTCHNDDKVKVPISRALNRLAGKTGTPTEIVPYDKIFKDVRARSPYSSRVAVGYPEFYTEDGGDRTFLPGGRCEGVKKVDQRWMVERIREMNGIISKAARRNGFRFVDPSKRFDGHELCSGGEEWIFGLMDGGRIHPTASGQAAIGQAVLENLAKDDAVGPAYTVQEGESIFGSFVVEAGKKLLSVIAQWPGSDVPLTLVSPSGKVYERSNPGTGTTHSNGPTWEQFEIPDPEPGTWSFKIYGSEVDPGGEPVNVLATTEEKENLPPVAVITRSQAGDVITFSSAEATDPDGRIERREWYVSEVGGTEIHQEGESIAVKVDQGNKNVSLVVTDDSGATAFASTGIPPTESPGAAGKRLRITKLQLQRRVRVGKRFKWRPTRVAKGATRLLLGVNAASRVRLTAVRSGKPAKQRVLRTRLRRGTNVINPRRTRKLLRVTRHGKLRIVARVSAGGQTSKRKIVIRRK